MASAINIECEPDWDLPTMFFTIVDGESLVAAWVCSAVFSLLEPTMYTKKC